MVVNPRAKHPDDIHTDSEPQEQTHVRASDVVKQQKVVNREGRVDARYGFNPVNLVLPLTVKALKYLRRLHARDSISQK